MEGAMTDTSRKTLEEWRAEAIERFGDFFKARFRCPACGHEASVEDFRQFKDRGATPDHAANRCIGRYDRSITDCDWCAFGLFRSGHVVVMEDGTEAHVFPFAEVADGS